MKHKFFILLSFVVIVGLVILSTFSFIRPIVQDNSTCYERLANGSCNLHKYDMSCDYFCMFIPTYYDDQYRLYANSTFDDIPFQDIVPGAYYAQDCGSNYSFEGSFLDQEYAQNESELFCCCPKI